MVRRFLPCCAAFFRSLPVSILFSFSPVLLGLLSEGEWRGDEEDSLFAMPGGGTCVEAKSGLF